MKQFLFFSIFCSLIACNNAEKTPANMEDVMKDSTKYTTIKWTDTAIDFGAKKMGDIVNINFTCTNTGSKPLYLYDVHPSCGCTLVDYSKEPIASGKQGKIEAQFDTKKSHVGEVHKTVFVRSNSSNASTNLSFSGTIIPTDPAPAANK